MAQKNWEADEMLNLYIYDYLVKKNLHVTANTFRAEGKISIDPVAIDAPGGFLYEWWSVFWDIFISRTDGKHSENAVSYIATQAIKERELQQQQQQQQMQMKQQFLLQRQAQQQQVDQQQLQQRNGAQVLNIVGNEPLMRRIPDTTANALAKKAYEDRLKNPLLRSDNLDDTLMKRFGENTSQLLDANHSLLPKSTPLGGHPSGTLQMPGSQQPPFSAKGVKRHIDQMMNPSAAGQERSLPGSNQGASNLSLKGWPLMGLEQLQSGILQQHNSATQSSQPFHPLQLQQQLLRHAQQQNITSAAELERVKLGMLFNNRNLGDAISNVSSAMQVNSHGLYRGDTDTLLKIQEQVQNSNQQQQQYLHQPRSSQQSQSSNHRIHHLDRGMAACSMTIEETMSITSQGNDQASKTQIAKKRKPILSSSGPAHSTGTTNTGGPSAPPSCSAPASPSAGDALSMPNVAGSSKSLIVPSSTRNQLADKDNLVDDGSTEDNVESFLKPDDAAPQDIAGFSFKEFQVISASTKVQCSSFSPDGKLLATGGHDKKVILWCTQTFTAKSTLEEHSQMITDVRFSPNLPQIATSSADKTVRVWDVDNPEYSLRIFTGHSAIVTSVDFHPTKKDLICSCDVNGEIRYWSISNGKCARVFKGGSTQVRFQPRHGRFLAAATENVVSIFNVETQACLLILEGHSNCITCLNWDRTGEYLASLSKEVVKVWALGPGNRGECIHELNCTASQFHSCIFHPTFTSLLVVGCYQTLELWNMNENKILTLSVHKSVVSSLSSASGMVASASHDRFIKLWK